MAGFDREGTMLALALKVDGPVRVWPKSACSGRVLVASEMESKMTAKAQARNDVGALLGQGPPSPSPALGHLPRAPPNFDEMFVP